jgi:putative YhbY family RNA-binding protein
MPEIMLTPKQRQALKEQAHGLKPVVLLGSSGLSAPVMKEIDRALSAHELIKVKIPGDDREERESLFAQVAEALSAARVQAIGKLLVLFRPAPEPVEAAEPPARAPTRARSPKAPARPAAPSPRVRSASKPSAPKRATADRREVERVNRGSAPRRDPGAATRAAGRTNVTRRGGGRGR